MIAGVIRRWAHAQLPQAGAEVLRPGVRGYLAAAIVCGPRAALRHARWRFEAWTLLPGDRVYDMRRRADGEVVGVPLPGRADVVWTPAEALRRYPDRIDALPVSEAGGPRIRECPDAPGGMVLTRWRERDVPARRIERA